MLTIVDSKLKQLFEKKKSVGELIRSANPIDVPPAIKQGGLMWSSRGGNVYNSPRRSLDAWEEPQFNVYDVGNAYHSDSIVHQALDKYVQLIFKEGYVFESKSERSKAFLRRRLRIMDEQSTFPGAGGETFAQNVLGLSTSIIHYSNSFVVKSRMRPDEWAKINKILSPISLTPHPRSNSPVQAYWRQPVEDTRIVVGPDLERKGRPKKYVRGVTLNSDSGRKSWPVEDVIHAYCLRPDGYAYGQPFVIACMEDLKLLRVLESNVAELIWRHIHPLLHVKVGETKEGFAARQNEVQEYRQMIQDMPTQGMIVTNERASINEVRVAAAAIDAFKYLEYFERRLIQGLGVSSVALGRGDTANRGASDVVTAQMRDNITQFQRIIADWITTEIFDELLQEAGFDILDDNQRVFFKFNTIDLDENFKKRNQILQEWLQNGLTLDEMRLRLGLDQMSEAEFKQTYYSKITKDLAVTVAKAKAAQSGTVSNVARPANQYGKKASPKVKRETADFISSLLFLQAGDEHKRNVSHLDFSFLPAVQEISNTVLGESLPTEGLADIYEKYLSGHLDVGQAREQVNILCQMI